MIRIAVLFSSLAFSGSAFASDEPTYRITRKGGAVILAVSYEEQKPWYIVTSPGGKQSRHMIDSVASIEKIEPGAVTGAAPNGSENWSEARLAARTRARDRARTAPPVHMSPPAVPPSVDQSQSDSGSTATGIPLHMGPRGGVFHYSASGKKVYQRKK